VVAGCLHGFQRKKLDLLDVNQGIQYMTLTIAGLVYPPFLESYSTYNLDFYAWQLIAVNLSLQIPKLPTPS
jgi:hypothetical protein